MTAKTALFQRAVTASAIAFALSAPAMAAGGDMTDRVIVKYNASVTGQAAGAHHQAASKVAARLGLTIKPLRNTAQGATVMKLSNKMSVAEAAKLAEQIKAADSKVEYAEPDRIMRPLLTPNDTRFGEQWHYGAVSSFAGSLNVQGAWDKSTGSGVVVAVLDTGITAHPDLDANIVAGYDFINDATVGNDGNGRDANPADPGDWVAANECGGTHSAQSSSWHGTHVAGTIGAVTNNALGVAGVAYGAKVQPVRVLGKCGGYTSDIADAIIWSSGGTVSGVPANATPAHVINMSLGGGGACDTTTQNAINSARSRGTTVVVAAGNDNSNAANYSPASCAGVVNVAAVGKTGTRAYYSNYGSSIDVAAPGGDQSSGNSNGVLSTLNSGTSSPGSATYAYYQGTSMAAPHVAGAVALMQSAYKAKNGVFMTPDAVESMLKSTSRPLASGACTQGCGSGIVDANAAVTAAQGGTGGGGGGGGTGTTINETESNGTMSTANNVATSGTTVNGTIGSTSDIDYFKVSLPAGKTLTTTLTPNSTSDYDLYVYNSNGTLIGSSENGTGQVDSVAVTNTGTSTFVRYIKVQRYAGGTGSTSGKYTVKFVW